MSLLVGTNDLSGLGETRDVDAIAEQFRDLIAAIRASAPDALLLVNSVMPRRRAWAETIQALNRQYLGIAADAGATYVDLWPALADTDGALRQEFTRRDHLHLNVPGYRAWVDVLRPHLAAVFAVRRSRGRPTAG